MKLEYKGYIIVQSNQYRLRDIRCVHLEIENADLQQRIDKVNQIIDELFLMGTNEYEIDEQLENIKRVLGVKNGKV